MSTWHSRPVLRRSLGFFTMFWLLGPFEAKAHQPGSTTAPDSTTPTTKETKPTSSPPPAKNTSPGSSPTEAPENQSQAKDEGVGQEKQPSPAEPADDIASPEAAPPGAQPALPEQDPTEGRGATGVDVPSPASPSPVAKEDPAPIGDEAPAASVDQPALDSDLLAPSEREAAEKPLPPYPIVEDPDPDMGLHEEGRLPGNPTRFQLTVRGLFANVGANNGMGGGRVGGLRADIGQTWNVMGYAISLTALGGRVQIRPEEDMLALIGGGPTISLGRFAMVGRGVADLRLGYDFFYAPGQGDTWAPHGPRFSFDVALLTSGRRLWQGFGISVGYQALVHSFTGDMPYAGLLTAGVIYWLG